jgi:hypothetical protein
MHTLNFSWPPGLLSFPETERLLVREVGFEPTNPYGTGASGLRIQDPYLVRVSLTWLGNTSRPLQADSRKPPGPAPADPRVRTMSLIGFPHTMTD